MQIFDTCHIFALGAGSKRGKRPGIGCDCWQNKLRLSRYYHNVLDGRTLNYDVEHIKIRYKDMLDKEPRIYRHRIAFGMALGYTKEIRQAIKHHEERNRGRTLCTKL